MIMVVGNDATLQLLLDKTPKQWPSSVRFLVKLAHVKDDHKHYWIAKRSDGVFVTITADHYLNFIGWGTIRKDDNGFMQIAQVVPPEIEEALRASTFITLKSQALSRVSGRGVKEG